MALEDNGVIVYQDLIDGVAVALKNYGKNIGAYASDIPDQLKASYSYSEAITVESGNTPKVVWTNSSAIGVVAETVFQNQFNGFCTDWFLTNDANKDTPISIDGMMRFISALICFIESKFAVVYSPLNIETKVFYFPDNTVDYSNITDIGILGDYIIDADGSRVLTEEGNYLITGSRVQVSVDKTTKAFLQDFLDKLTKSTLTLSKSFCATTSVTTIPK